MKKLRICFLLIPILVIAACKSTQTSQSDATSLDSKPNYQRDAAELGKCSRTERNYRESQGGLGVVGGLVGSVVFVISSMILTPVGGLAITGALASTYGPTVGGIMGQERNNLCGLQDLDFAQYQGDWSLRRIKRSCPPYYPLAGVKHVSNIEVNIGCSPNSFSKKEEDKMLANAKMGRKGKDVFIGITPPVYRYVDRGATNAKWGYSLDCGENEYVAGVSFGVTDITYGIKSILCGRIPEGRKGKSCTYLGDKTDECPENQYMMGMYVQRGYRNGNIGGNVGQEATGRLDDMAEYADQVKGVSCCSL